MDYYGGLLMMMMIREERRGPSPTAAEWETYY
jgi:hypothetical protein